MTHVTQSMTTCVLRMLKNALLSPVREFYNETEELLRPLS